MRNPYYRFDLARRAFLERDYDAAISNLEFAIRKKEWEDSFYFLLGLSYLQKGDEKRARKWLEQGGGSRGERCAEAQLPEQDRPVVVGGIKTVRTVKLR